MNELKAAMVGFDITPRFHREFGAWGTTPHMTEVDMPLLSRCLVLEQDKRRLIWFGSDLVGEIVPGTDIFRDEVAQALGMKRDQINWSTSQTHASGAVPGSGLSGSSICELTEQDPKFVEVERKRFINAYIEAAREAIDLVQPVSVWAGRGHCESISYNSRFPMPTGGCKFSRHHSEGLQSGKYFDPTIGLVRFEDKNGKPIGAIFNFNCHPAVLILEKHISPDYVGTARQYVEEAIDGAPAMFVQGFCGDIHPYHMFGTPEQAKRIGTRLGRDAAKAMPTLIPVRSEPFGFMSKTIELQCQPMPSRKELEDQLAECNSFIEELKYDPVASWCGGVNFPEQFTAEQRADCSRLKIEYLKEATRILDAGEQLPQTQSITLGAVRIGDVAAVFSPGENFALTGRAIRAKSPFLHTLICGDTNGLFGYIGPDDEIDRGGAETDYTWKILTIGGLRPTPAKGSAERIVNTAVELLNSLEKKCP